MINIVWWSGSVGKRLPIRFLKVIVKSLFCTISAPEYFSSLLRLPNNTLPVLIVTSRRVVQYSAHLNFARLKANSYSDAWRLDAWRLTADGWRSTLLIHTLLVHQGRCTLFPFCTLLYVHISLKKVQHCSTLMRQAVMRQRQSMI